MEIHLEIPIAIVVTDMHQTIHKILLSVLAAIITAGCSHTPVQTPSPEVRHINVDSIYEHASTYRPDSLTADAIYLSMALLRPEESIKALRERVKGGKITDGKFPLVAENAMWGAAAWETYCATGSREWLKEAYDILTASVRTQWKLTGSQLSPLSFGTPEYSVTTPGYYPDWMDDMDRFQTISTSVNAERAYTHNVLSLMAGELNLYAEREHHLSASRLRNAINDRLWIPDRQHYAAYLYGLYFPIQYTASDAIANSLCALFDIATPEMAEAMIRQMPVMHKGIPLLYPGNPATDNVNAQTLFALAAAKVRNPIAFATGASGLLSISPSDESLSPWLTALVTRGFFGMQLTPDGIRFSPMVPSDYPDIKHIRGLHYREATLDINLHGTGDRIASFSIDSVSAATPLFPADMTGEHRIDITLTGNDLTKSHVNTVNPAEAPAIPKVAWSSPLRARIVNFNPELKYQIYLNGALHEEIVTESWSLTPTDGSPLIVNIIARDADGNSGLSPRSHSYTPAGSSLTINASSVTPRRAPLHFIKDRATATNYIELAARHNTRITCYANIEEEGDYYLTVGYSNGSGHMASRTLGINDRDVATMLCPAGRPNDWITVIPSNTVTVRLRKGVNKIALTYIRGTMLLNKITLLKKP